MSDLPSGARPPEVADASTPTRAASGASDARTHRMGALARALHLAVRGYRRLTAGRLSPCRFDPSCSTYALEALERHGAGRGTWLSLRRLTRCHPWGGVGWDPVPERKAN